MSDNYNTDITRQAHFAEKIVFVDGLPGCGKTMLSPIIASLDRVELLSYSYEIEYICAMYYMKKIDSDAAKTMVRMLTDLKLYNTMMSRETNFRPTDLSSVFRDADPLRYIIRLFQKGDETIPAKIAAKKPILNIAIHNILAYSEPIFAGLGNRAVLIEVVRHPLYMIKQQRLNMKSLIASARDFTIYFSYKDMELPYYTAGWEDLFIAAKPIEKSIYMIDKLTAQTDLAKKEMKEKYSANIITIPFELFVKNPLPYLTEIERLLGTKVTSRTRRMMKKQNVPRKMYAEGIGLKIYKRCGWEPPKFSTEKEELGARRRYAAELASKEAMAVLDGLSADYESKYLGG